MASNKHRDEVRYPVYSNQAATTGVLQPDWLSDVIRLWHNAYGECGNRDA